MLSLHSFEGVRVSHIFGGMTLIFRGTFLATVRFESETLILVSEQLSSSTDNLLISYHDKLVKWKQGVFDLR